MKNTDHETSAAGIAFHGRKPALQVICLGNSGGPSEENVTGLLVRSINSNWAKGSLLAVDAGSHLAPIIRILERHFPSVSKINHVAETKKEHEETVNGTDTGDLAEGLAEQSLSPATSSSEADSPPPPQSTTLDGGAFAGLSFPNASARANALHVLRHYISTYLITHPHLDHLSGFTINTAAFNGTTRPKTVAALPSTVDAIKRHIFNDVIWPNLTDEDGGVGFVTFQRLKEGGDVMVGEGDGRGYIDVCDGLGVRAFKVSHGVCTKSPPAHHHRGSISLPPAEHQSLAPYTGQLHDPTTGRAISISQHSQYSVPGTPGTNRTQSFFNSHGGQTASPSMAPMNESCVVDSTAYFVRDCDTAREVLIFGDVEPDTISLSPRNHIVWQEAARKIAHGHLGGIFIECSFDNSHPDAVLFGHLNPKHLIAELQALSGLVIEARAHRLLERGVRKRKRSGPNGLDQRAREHVEGSEHKRSRSHVGRTKREEIRRSSVPDHAMTDVSHGMTSLPLDAMAQHVGHPPPQLHAHFAPWSEEERHLQPEPPLSPHGGEPVTAPKVEQHHFEAARSHGPPLHGVKIVVIHIKDTLKDGPHVSENILAQLNEHEARLKEEGQALGCEFIVSESGESYWF